VRQLNRVPLGQPFDINLPTCHECAAAAYKREHLTVRRKRWLSDLIGKPRKLNPLGAVGGMSRAPEPQGGDDGNDCQGRDRNRSCSPSVLSPSGSLDGEPGGSDIGQPPFWFFLQAQVQQLADFRRCGSGQLLPVRLAIQHSRQRVLLGLPVKSTLAGEQLKEEASECPDVGPLVDMFATRLLGAHVPRCAENVAGESVAVLDYSLARKIFIFCRSPNRAGEAEVQDLYPVLRRNLHIGGFQIPVNNALLMRRLQPVGDLSRIVERFFEWHLTVQSLALDEFEDQVIKIAGLVQFVY
jgi:hypothetical protein